VQTIENVSDTFDSVSKTIEDLVNDFARSQFTVGQKKPLQIYKVPTDTEVALRTVAKEQSTGTSQGFLKCVCKTECQNKKCIFLKNNVFCTSKCHFSTTCCDK